MGERDLRNPQNGLHVSRIAGILSLACVLACTGLLSVRQLANADLGYHLAYGDEFWKTGRPVDGNDFIYTVKTAPRTGPLTDVPGCYYDADGVFRFPNANWGTQAIMSAVNRLAGPVGLCVLQSALVMGIFALILASMLKWKLPPVLCAAALLVTAAVSHTRFNLRPEVFGYLILAGQFYVLSGLYWAGDGRITWRGAVVLVVLQLLLVNLHSYFMLGLALTSAVLAEHALRVGFSRFVRPVASAPGSRRLVRYMLIVLAAQVAVCFVNPWTWRIAILPIQTLIYLKQHQIAAGPQISSHPWATLGELFRPFDTATYLPGMSVHVLVVVLMFAVPAAIVAAAKRRWAILLVLAGMVLVATSVRRNIAAGGLLLTPLVVLLLWTGIRRLSSMIGPVRRRGYAAGIVLSVVLIAASAVGACLVVTNRLYYMQRTSLRFGVGLSDIVLPTEAAVWLNKHKPVGRLWCGLTSSSNIHYLMDSRPQVPILTNTWAYPPIVMRQVLDHAAGKPGARDSLDRYGVQIVVLLGDRPNARLVRRLATDTTRWSLVNISGNHVVFLRKNGPNAKLAARAELTDLTFDLDACITRMDQLDSQRSHISLLTGQLAFRMGWNRVAVALTDRATQLDPNFHEAWDILGLALLQRGQSRLNAMRLAGDKTKLLMAHANEYLYEARQCFEKSLELAPAYDEAARHLLSVEQQLRELKLWVLPNSRFM